MGVRRLLKLGSLSSLKRKNASVKYRKMLSGFLIFSAIILAWTVEDTSGENQPNLTSVETLSETQIRVTWEAMEDADHQHYELYIDNYLEYFGKDLMYVARRLTPDTIYHFKLRSCHQDMNECTIYSKTLSGTTTQSRKRRFFKSFFQWLLLLFIVVACALLAVFMGHRVSRKLWRSFLYKYDYRSETNVGPKYLVNAEILDEDTLPVFAKDPTNKIKKNELKISEENNTPKKLNKNERNCKMNHQQQNLLKKVSSTMVDNLIENEDNSEGSYQSQKNVQNYVKTKNKQTRKYENKEELSVVENLEYKEYLEDEEISGLTIGENPNNEEGYPEDEENSQYVKYYEDIKSGNISVKEVYSKNYEILSNGQISKKTNNSRNDEKSKNERSQSSITKHIRSSSLAGDENNDLHQVEHFDPKPRNFKNERSRASFVKYKHNRSKSLDENENNIQVEDIHPKSTNSKNGGSKSKHMSSSLDENQINDLHQERPESNNSKKEGRQAKSKHKRSKSLIVMTENQNNIQVEDLDKKPTNSIKNDGQAACLAFLNSKHNRSSSLAGIGNEINDLHSQVEAHDEYSKPINTKSVHTLALITDDCLTNTNDDARAGIVVVIDNSNIYIGAQECANALNPKERRRHIRVKIQHLTKILERGRLLDEGYVQGSSPPTSDQVWEVYRRLGYCVNLEDRRGKDEQRVDEGLHLNIYKAICELSPRKLVIASGDGNKGKSEGATSLPGCAQAALERGWHVEVHSWQHSLSTEWLKLTRRYPTHFTIHYLDRYVNYITFVDGKNGRKSQPIPTDFFKKPAKEDACFISQDC